MLYSDKEPENQDKEIFMVDKKNESQVRKMSLSRYFLLFFVPPAILIATILTIFYRMETGTTMAEILASEGQILKTEEIVIVDDFKSVLSDLLFLAGQHGLEEISEADKTANIIDDLARDYLLLSDKKKLYDQIRILDREGMEIVRVNFNGGEPVSVPKGQLQNKSNRYYFSETFRLGRSEVYISPFDLNIEKGEIELPLKPMIRFGTPFFDGQGDKQGVVVLNYLGVALLNKFGSAAANAVGNMMILNADGFWLKGPDPENEWGFMYEDGKEKIFGKQYPAAWSAISRADSGQFQNTDGLFSFTTLYPLREIYKAGMMPEVSGGPDNAYHWKIVSHVPSALLKEKRDKLLKKLFLFYAVLIVLTSIACWFLANLSMRRRRAVEGLRESEKRYADIYENAPDMYVSVDASTANIIRCNQTLASNIGYNKDEIVGKPIFDMYHPDCMEDVKKAFRSFVETGEVKDAELQLKRKDGSRIDVSLNVTSVRDENGKVISSRSTWRDITDRKRSEMALIKSEERYELAESAGNIGSWDWNILTGELYWTKNIEPVFGFGPGEFGATYEAFLDSVHPDDRKFLVDSVNAAVEEGKDYAIEHRIVWPDKSIRWVSETGAVFNDEEGKAVRMLGIVQDITPRKRAEEELNHKRRLAAMGEMSAHLAHEIRNPLNTVGMSYEALSESEDLSDHDREILEIMSRGLKTLNSIAMDLLDYGRAGKLSREPFDGPELIEAVLSDLENKIVEKDVEVIRDFPGTHPPVNADRVKIRQVFTNLIDNALQAMPEGGKLTILAAEADGKFVVNVSDTGIGMASEDLDKIFDPFFTTKQEGTGLGMAILKHFVELHSGEVSVESVLGKGTTVTITLPI